MRTSDRATARLFYAKIAIMDTKHEHDFAEELYGIRLLVLMECDDHFHQVRLSPEQFKKISGLVACSKHASLPLPIPEKPHINEEVVHVTDDWRVDADLFLGLEDFYADVCPGENEKDPA
jgi:hypothetical protein